jgi:hypothetical protein
MREIKFVVAIVANPTGPEDTGTVTEAHYYVEKGTLFLCDSSGTPLGEKQRLEKGQDEIVTAKRLALRLHNASYPDNGGFNRVIHPHERYRVPC